MKLKRNDLVKVIAGKYKGKTGKILQVLPLENQVVVDGVNLRVRHIKARGGNPGQKVEFFGPLNASNVMYLGADGIATKLGSKKLDTGKTVRLARKSGETLSN